MAQDMNDLSLELNGTSLEIAYIDRHGPDITIIYLHGLGCSKSDFAAMVDQPALNTHRLVALDFPGCGGSSYSADNRLQIDDLVELTRRFVEELELADFLVVGGSMGGLVGLLFCHRHPELAKGFVNAEGNLAPEDCMFSELVAGHSYEDFVERILPDIKRNLAIEERDGPQRHLEILEADANPLAYYDYSKQTKSYSFTGTLLTMFTSLEIPCLFLYGSDNQHLSYLSYLTDSSVDIQCIPDAGHFLFYDNPLAYARSLSNFAVRLSKQQSL